MSVRIGAWPLGVTPLKALRPCLVRCEFAEHTLSAAVFPALSVSQLEYNHKFLGPNNRTVTSGEVVTLAVQVHPFHQSAR